MKRQTALIILVLSFNLFLGLHPGLAAGTDFRNSIQYEWWQSNKHDHGTQLYDLIEVDSHCKDVSVQLLGAYAYTYVHPSASTHPSDSLSHFTDTKLNLSYALSNKLPVDILFGLGFNLPTGFTDLKRKDLALIVPPDLIPITTYGEGFNVNPLMIVVKEWDEWDAGIGLGYTWRGKYDYSFDVKDYDPGDIFKVTAEVENNITPEFNARAFGEYQTYGKDQVDGRNYYQEGNVTLLGLGASYSKNNWMVEGDLQNIMRAKSRFPDFDGNLETEGENSHGNEWVADLFYNYYPDKETALYAGLKYLNIKKNDYPASAGLFIGKREKTTLAIGTVRSLRTNMKGSLDLKVFYMKDDKNVFHADNLKYRGASLGGTFIYSF